MIEFEVLASPDKETLGHHLYHKNLIYLGNEQGDLLFRDPKVLDFHLRFELTAHGFICFKGQDVEYFLVNGKRTTSNPILKEQDTIGIGDTLIKLSRIQLVNYPSKKAIIEQSLTKIITDEGLRQVRELIEILEEDLQKYTETK